MACARITGAAEHRADLRPVRSAATSPARPHRSSLRPRDPAGAPTPATSPAASAMSALLSRRSRPPTSGSSTSLVARGIELRACSDAATPCRATASAVSRLRLTYDDHRRRHGRGSRRPAGGRARRRSGRRRSQWRCTTSDGEDGDERRRSAGEEAGPQQVSGEWYQPAAPISGSVTPASAKPRRGAGSCRSGRTGRPSGRVVAAVRQAVVEAEREAAPDDLGLGQVDERRVDRERPPLDAGPGGQRASCSNASMNSGRQSG